MTIGKRISNLRKERGFTQEYVADKLNVSRQAVSKWEQDLTCPDSWNLIELAKLFETSVEYLTIGTKPTGPAPIPLPIPTKSYCGRDCSNCDVKAKLECTSCKYTGQGLPAQRCDIAACCSRSGLKACNQCRSADDCRLRANRDTFSVKRCEKLEAENELRLWQQKITKECGIWFAILPFMAIGNLLLDLFLVELLPPLALIFGFGYCLCLFKLVRQSDNFKIAAIFMAIMAVLRCVAGFVAEAHPVLIYFYNLIFAIAVPVAICNELHGCECINYVYTGSQSRLYSTLRGAFGIIGAVQLLGLIGYMFTDINLLALLFFVAYIAYFIVEIIHIFALFHLKGLVGRL